MDSKHSDRVSLGKKEDHLLLAQVGKGRDEVKPWYFDLQSKALGAASANHIDIFTK